MGIFCESVIFGNIHYRYDRSERAEEEKEERRLRSSVGFVWVCFGGGGAAAAASLLFSWLFWVSFSVSKQARTVLARVVELLE